MAVELLLDELWQEIEPLLPLPPPSPRTRKGGRPPVGNRQALRGILFVDRTGLPWQMLPREAFGVSGSSCWRRLRDWTAAGIWPRLHGRLIARLDRAGGGLGLERAGVDSQSVRALRGGRTPAPTPRTGPSPGANATS